MKYMCTDITDVLIFNNKASVPLFTSLLYKCRFMKAILDCRDVYRRAVTRELFSVTTELTLMFESTSHVSMDYTPSL